MVPHRCRTHDGKGGIWGPCFRAEFKWPRFVVTTKSLRISGGRVDIREASGGCNSPRIALPGVGGELDGELESAFEGLGLPCIWRGVLGGGRIRHTFVSPRFASPHSASIPVRVRYCASASPTPASPPCRGTRSRQPGARPAACLCLISLQFEMVEDASRAWRGANTCG